MLDQQLNLLSFSGKIRVLHLTWFAFFISFMAWFAHAPLMMVIRESMHLSDQEVKVLLILNVVLTIPARIVVGMLVDKLGSRVMFSTILIIGGLITFGFALAQNFQQLAIARFLSGFIGAGFVVGIRMISDWFPAHQTGIAQGIYGGWGNLGAAGAALLLPSIALYLGEENGWRYAIAMIGLISIVYGVIYFYSVFNIPNGSTNFKPKNPGVLKVGDRGDLLFYVLTNIPMYLALGVLTWKLSARVHWFHESIAYNIYMGLTGLYVYHVWKIIQANSGALNNTVPEYQRYSFSQVAVLELAYMVTFGAELAMVSMLPLFYIDTFGVEPILAGILAGIYAMINLFARPVGGWLSDQIGRKVTLSTVTAGIAGSFLLLGQMSAGWSLGMVMVTIILGGIFSKAGSGAVYAIIPLIERGSTGQIAGMVGAYGNVGGVIFLTMLSFVSPPVFFTFIACTAGLIFIAEIVLLIEPKGQMTGTLQVKPHR